MTDIEIPYEKDRNLRYRLFEILPGSISWLMLLMPFILSFISITASVFFVVAYLLIFIARAIGVDIRVLQGYSLTTRYQKLHWEKFLDELENLEVDSSTHIKRPKWHLENIDDLKANPTPISKPSEVIHVAMVATVNESREVLEPTIRTIIESDYNMKQVVLVIAYEGRAGQETEDRVNSLLSEYGHHFMHAMAVKHPANIPGEVIGKGGNITFAGRELQKYIESKSIDPSRVIVTTLDADNHPHRKYFAALSYVYCLTPEPNNVSFQPVVMYTNNIWDAPAPMRVIATGNTIWNMALTLRPHALRNFSSHAQSLKALIDTDFWSVRTIVEDGHQFWRTYFRYDGHHDVYPIYLPIYQDAVLARTYLKTLKAQFIQLRRWTYGASDVAYVADKGFFTKNKVPKKSLIPKLFRLLEGHVTWAVAPPLLLYAGFIPALLHPQSYSANALPLIVGRVQEFALVGILASLFICFKVLPPKPARYKAHRSVLMMLQWVLLPITSLVYASSAALYSQTRLMLGKYIGKFDLTEKAVVTADKKTIT